MVRRYPAPSAGEKQLEGLADLRSDAASRLPPRRGPSGGRSPAGPPIHSVPKFPPCRRAPPSLPHKNRVCLELMVLITRAARSSGRPASARAPQSHPWVSGARRRGPGTASSEARRVGGAPMPSGFPQPSRPPPPGTCAQTFRACDMQLQHPWRLPPGGDHARPSRSELCWQKRNESPRAPAALGSPRRPRRPPSQRDRVPGPGSGRVGSFSAPQSGHTRVTPGSPFGVGVPSAAGTLGSTGPLPPRSGNGPAGGTGGRRPDNQQSSCTWEPRTLRAKLGGLVAVCKGF